MRRFDAGKKRGGREAGFSDVLFIAAVCTIVVLGILALFLVHTAHHVSNCIANPASCSTPTTMPGAGLP
ncbi:MAG: hypothetical protein M1522_07255 [Actinobacteria bacterium]|jgi:hypothetical protein|nr:hypothetical protein [Actinomycetota bacterium]